MSHERSTQEPAELQGEERIFVTWVADRPGVLTRVASVFFRRSINIMSLNVAASELPAVSKMVIRAAGSVEELAHLELLIERLVDVLRVELLDPEHATLDELCFARVAVADEDERNEILSITAAYRPTIRRIDTDSMVLKLTATPTTIDHFVDTLKRFSLLDISRTGVTTTPGRRGAAECADEAS